MNKYQIVEAYGAFMHAGSKATNDCVSILNKAGFKPLVVTGIIDKKGLLAKLYRQGHYYKDWRKIYQTIEQDSVLILQHPFRRKQLGRYHFLTKLKHEKRVQIISLVHDVELIRNIYELSFYEKELKQMLAYADKIIVHNAKMKEWFINYGVEEDRLVDLEIFDYLNQEPLNKKIDFAPSIVIAGNLSHEKSPYIYKLGDLNPLSIELLGINYQPKDKAANIHYKGSFPADAVPAELNHGFGLVWDGGDLSTCSGPTGEYLRYNNPHKLSLYLSSGLPVIIWSQAALADFVKENQLGITVDSLYDLQAILSKISQEDYLTFCSNVKKVMKAMQNGDYLKKAIDKSMLPLK
ncbi:glycosyl transferase [Streptococcus sp. H49]|uniref:glycosyl transferase n=1 Tax=Streptococcus huangxiaojuni TaxID=3237239 RepID=UPI0034A36CBC